MLRQISRPLIQPVQTPANLVQTPSIGISFAILFSLPNLQRKLLAGELYCIVLYLLPVLNPKSYDGARLLETSGRPILAGEEQSLRMDRPSTLSPTTVHNMASVFDNQGQYNTALKYCYERVFLGGHTRLGGHHPGTQNTHLSSLATWICPLL